MKNKSTVMVRYTGIDENRRFLLERADFKYWTGDGWSKILDNARVFFDHKSAQRACAAIQHKQYRGKPVRTFKVEVEITLVADEVECISKAELTNYLSAALRLDMENSVHGDGPVPDSFVRAKMRLATLEETKPPCKVF